MSSEERIVNQLSIKIKEQTSICVVIFVIKIKEVVSMDMKIF